ncbi:MAG: TIM44-like domain-containing protein, partial [Myxococcota bacterium]
IIVAIAVIREAVGNTDKSWSTIYGDVDVSQWSNRPQRKVRLTRISAHDAGFSRVLLEDFLYGLYVRCHEARPDAVASLAPYLTPAARRALQAQPRGNVIAVSAVVVGGMTLRHLSMTDTTARLTVGFEANFTETYAAAEERLQLGLYSRERWILERKLTAKTRDPDQVRAFNCPSCAAPVQDDAGDACAHCGATHATGEHAWVVHSIKVEQAMPRPPGLTGYAEEVGTLSPTLVDKGLARSERELQAHDPEFSRQDLFARTRLIYDAMNEAWTSLLWEHARPFTSDRFWLSMRYWINAYRDSDLHNVMEAARITRIEMVDVELDAHYQSVTVRIFATALDYTQHSGTGAVVGGNRHTPRDYSEYWTLIRARDCKGGSCTERNCPNCGAPLAITMAGNCEHCSVKITAGAADWVLSTIQQDETYAG